VRDRRNGDAEENLLRAVALQNATSILVARRRAEEELVRAKEALELKTQELARSLAMMRATLESTTDGILVTDGAGKVTGFNQKYVDMWRIPVDVLESSDHRRLIEVHASQFRDPPGFLAAHQDIQTASPAESFDLLKLADGRVFERSSRRQVVADQNVGRVWSFRDITERMRAEEGLRQNVETTRFLADATATLAELTDYVSTLQRVASLAVPSFADWCAVDMLEGDGSIRRVAITHADSAKVSLAHELFGRHPPQPSDPFGVARVLRAGSPEWMPTVPDEVLASMVLDEAERGILQQLGFQSYICVPLRSRSKMIGALTFVTAQSGRTYGPGDLAAAEDLAHRAVIAIENASLLEALKDSDRRKDEFLAMLAHELRNPLAPIRNSVEVLRAQSECAPQVAWATDVIDRQVQQMTRLVDDLLDVSRIASGKIQLRLERVDLAAVVSSAIEASRPLIDNRGHELTVVLPPEPVWLEADMTRLSQVVLNLLNNAAKYTDRGGRIALTVTRQADQVGIGVKDTGIGIPLAMQPHVFEMFTQVDRSLARSQGGLGIGLTLVQRLVEMHAGTVAVHSDGPGQGSEFIVRLPIATESQTARAPAPAARSEAVPARAASRILVVDDNTDAADSLALLLRMAGNDVRTAADGLEAVGVAGAFQPAVVLLDIGLPKLNGYEAARRIREQQGDGVLLIALTGWGQEEDRRRSAEAGFDHHLTKPINPEALQKLLGAPRSARSG
jgi:signal transduction histidine kinase/PAS domain-containing protein/ActR/RegA family two-component response regulator